MRGKDVIQIVAPPVYYRQVSGTIIESEAYWKATTPLMHANMHCRAVVKTLRVAQSIIATKYKKPFLTGM